jgi:hypothetical protein
MANNRQAHAEEAWTNARKICRLTARQLEMARALGMNPRKLPRLRPRPQQRWKLPVGEFIEEFYRKRFGEDARTRHAAGLEPQSRKSSTTGLADGPERDRNPKRELGDLACYPVNLTDDLQRWLAHGSIDPDVLRQVREELEEVADALDTGAPIPPVPTIPVPPPPMHRRVSKRRDQARTFDDDEIPF